MKRKNKHVPTISDLLLYQTGDSKTNIEVKLQDETVWMSQMAMAELFQTTIPNINIHLNNTYEEGELSETATIKDYLIVRQEGSRQVRRSVTKEIADKLALDHYETFNRHRLEKEAKEEALADDEELKHIETVIEKKKRRRMKND